MLIHRLGLLFAAILTLLGCGHAEIAAPLAMESSPIGRLVAVDPVTRAEGKGLAIASYEARVEILGRLAQTTLTHVFTNEGNVQLEGTFIFPLPPGASMSRFAMDVNGAMMEGEIVERRRGRAIYEDIVRSMKDPALLEMTEGNTFKARVFPIEALGQKTVVLAFTQELELAEGALRYTLPLRSEAFTSHRVGKVSISVRAETAGGYSRMEHSMNGIRPEGPHDPLELGWDFAGAPGRDLTLALYPNVEPSASLEIAPADAATTTQARQAYFSVRDRAPSRRGPGFDGVRRVVFLVDTSASVTREELAEACVLLEAMGGELRATDLAAIIAFDRTCVSVLGGGAMASPTANALQAGIQALRSRGSLGGSDLEGALLAASAALAAVPASGPGAHDVVVLIGDGIATLGEMAPQALLARVQALGAQLLPVPVGSQHNHSLLRAAARLGGGVVTVAVPGADNSALPRLVMSLAQPGALVTDLRAIVRASDGAETVHDLDNVRPGGEIAFSGRVTGDPATITYQLEGRLGGEAWSARREPGALPATHNALLPRHWASGRIESLLVEEQSQEVKAKVIALSERFRVMTPYTVFLVLESEEAYKQNQIARRASRARNQRSGESRGASPEHNPEDPAAPERDARPGDEQGEELLEGLLELEEAESEGGGEQLRFGMSFDDEFETADEEDFGSAPPAEPQPGAPSTGRPTPAPPARTSPPPAERAADQDDDGDGGGRPREDFAKKVPMQVAIEVTPVPRNLLPTLAIAFAAGGDAAIRPATAADQVAINQAMAAVDASPRSRNARKALGLLLLAARDHVRAASWSRDWILIDPRNLTPYLHLGKALARQGESHTEEALRAFTSLVDVRPGEAQSHRLLGRMLVNYGLFGEARRQFELAMEDRPDDPSGLQDLAQLAVAMGEFSRAADLFATLAEKDWPDHHGPVRDLARQQLGLLYLRLEGRARAAGNLQEAAGWATRRSRLGDDHFRPRDVKVLINWDTTGTDIDLWVTGPDGQKCFYSNKVTPMGGNLYADITTGFGPEIYYLDQAAYGDYEVTVHYYSAAEADDTQVRALIVLFEGTARQEIHEVDLTLHQTGDEVLVGKITLTR